MTQPGPLSVPLPWNLVADDYVAEVTPMFEAFAKNALAAAALGSGAKVLDVAAGPGTLALLAARAGANVTAIDFSEEMIARLRARADAERVRIETHVADAQALPFADANFDAGFSMFGLMFFPDRAKGFAELHRVLRPGSPAVVSSWQPLDSVPAFTTIFSTLREMIPGMPPDRAGPLTDPKVFRDEMTAGGFRDVKVLDVMHTEIAASIETYWASVERTMAPLLLIRKRVGDEAWAAISRAIRERLVARYGPGPQAMSMAANLGFGRV